ncbi:MAG: polysaccharide deacetylase [Phycisphaerae bacterium]
MRTPGVYITIDVECSMGGAWDSSTLLPVAPERAVLGRYGRASYGLPLITGILREHGLAGTFFVEPFDDEIGYPGRFDAFCSDLLDAEQDVQLHIHPNHKSFGRCRSNEDYIRNDRLCELPYEYQVELVREGADRFKRITGKTPKAFRAGNMAADENSLSALAAAGIQVDSSYTFTYAGRQCGFSAERPFNGTRWYGSVLEVALSGFRQPSLPALHPCKPLDLVSVSFPEMQSAVRKICSAGAEAVLILHSFSLMKVRNIRYDGGRPNRVVIRRLRQLCRWLAENRQQYPTRTFSDIAGEVDQGIFHAREVPPAAVVKPIQAVTRKAVQGVNRWYWM